MILSKLLLFATAVQCGLCSNDDQRPIHPEPAPVKGLNNIPDIGLGLWNSKGEDATHAVAAGLKAGYIHFDSAAAYGNEGYVGTGFENATLPRRKYWITSKLWNDHHEPDLVGRGIAGTLQKLNTTRLDLYLMHWPVAFKPNEEGRTIIDQDTTIMDTWRAMEALVKANLTRYIGVSNFSPRQLDTLLRECEIRPYAHEFETHPYLQQQEFVNWHHEKGIKVIAYSPLANLNPTYNGTHENVPSLLDDPFWKKLAKKHNVTVPQAALSWGRQRATSVIPKSVHEKYIYENFHSQVNFSKSEIEAIAEQDRKVRFNNPSKAWGVELFEGLDDGSNRFMNYEELKR